MVSMANIKAPQKTCCADVSCTGKLPARTRLATRLLASAVFAMLPLSSVQAIGLWQAYEAALQNDPTYLSARYENDAGRENQVIGRANLLPTVSASYSQGKNWAVNKIGANTSEPDYLSKSASVNLRQTLINFDAFARFRQGQAQSAQSEATFTGRSHELMLRVLTSYLDVLFAADQLTLATAQRDTLLEQRRVNDKMFNKGEGTRTDMLETQAKLDVAEAQVIEMRDNLAAVKDVLSGVVGSSVNNVDGLGKEFKVRPMQPAAFEDWQRLALEKNPELLAQKQAIEIAEQEIRKSRAGHAPRLDLVASYNKSKSESLTTLNQDATVRSIGLQLNIPLYSGGYVNATSRQAVAGHEKSKADLVARSARVLQDLRKQYSAALNGAAKIEALQKAVESGRLLIQATQQSIKGGVRINLDLLNARQQFYATQRDLAQAKYNYLISYVRLRAAAGVLEQEDIRSLSAYFNGGK